MSDNMIGISQITHQPSYQGEYTPIINLDIDKKYYTSKVFYYDLNIINIGSSSSTKSPSINLILRLSITDKSTVNLKSNIIYTGLSKETNVKGYTILEETTDKVKLRVLISNYGQAFVRWAVYPNFISNLVCKNSLLPPAKDIYTTDEFNAITNKNEIEEYVSQVSITETLQVDTINHNKSDVVNINAHLLPQNNGYYNLGNKDFAFKSGWFSHFLKLPYQSPNNVKSILQGYGGNCYALVNPRNKKLMIYYVSEDKWYDALGNDVTSEI